MKEVVFEIDDSLPLEEIFDELLYYRKIGVYAYCTYKGIKLDNKLADNVLRKRIDMIKQNMNKEEYDSYELETKRKKNVDNIILKKLTINPSTRFWINSVIKYLPDDLKTTWEYDCYYKLLYDFIKEETIKYIAFLITAFYTEQSENELLKAVRLVFLFLNDSQEINEVIYFLKKYSTNQEVLEKYVYSSIDKGIPTNFDSKKEFSKIYNYIYSSHNSNNKKE